MNLWVVSILFIVVYGRLVVGGEDETAKISKTNHSITTERKIILLRYFIQYPKYKQAFLNIDIFSPVTILLTC